MSDPGRLTLVLRFADVGVATYASLRVVGQPSRTVTWVVEEPLVLAALQQLADPLPEPRESESRRDAIERALTRGPFAARDTELAVAYILGVLLIASSGWQLLMECAAAPRAVLFVSPSARLARVPWGLLAVPTSGPSAEELIRARQKAVTATGTVPAQRKLFAGSWIKRHQICGKSRYRRHAGRSARPQNSALCSAPPTAIAQRRRVSASGQP
jgi:hypothetical protein